MMIPSVAFQEVTHVQEREPWRISRTGALGRRGETTVVVRGGRAILTTPPGEAGVFTSAELFKLIDALREARNELFPNES